MLLKGANPMAVDVLNAFVGHPPMDYGVFFRAPIGTTLPTDASGTLDPAFDDHGAVGEGGLTIAQNRSSADIRMMGGGVFVDTQESYDETLTITLLEDDNDAVLKTAFGDANVEVTPATAADGTKRTIYHTADPLPLSSFVVRTAYGDKNKVYVVARGRVSSVAEVVEQHTNVTSRQLTIKTFRPTELALKGGNVVEYRDDGRPTA